MKANPLIVIAIGGLCAALPAVAVGVVGCAHARAAPLPLEGMCEKIAIGCPGKLAVCASDGEAACVSLPEDETPSQ